MWARSPRPTRLAGKRKLRYRETHAAVRCGTGTVYPPPRLPQPGERKPAVASDSESPTERAHWSLEN
jgi:hypothetical protein